jgi:hypothetical protein
VTSATIIFETIWNKEKFEHISCAVRLPKVVLYLFFVDLGKKSAGPACDPQLTGYHYDFFG